MKIIILLLVFAAPLVAAETDNRQVLNLSEPQRHYVLNEMRSLLAGVQNIITGLAQDDMAAIAASAKAIGFNMKHKSENPLHDVLPKDFMMLGMSMHKDFDVLAEQATASKDPKHTLVQLGEVLGKCTACHAAYQIQPGQAMSSKQTPSEARLDEVAQQGRQVMPFDLEWTQHVFTKTENGGIQQVVVKDKADKGQIKLVREHLSKISREFAQGDFSSPAKIHGGNMPGLEGLRNAKPGQLSIGYKELDDGAEISYATGDALVKNALHEWFDAQLKDHARHAVSGHQHHMLHQK